MSIKYLTDLKDLDGNKIIEKNRMWIFDYISDSEFQKELVK